MLKIPLFVLFQMQSQDRTGRYDCTKSVIQLLKIINQHLTSCYSIFFQFLGDEETVRKAIESVAAQGKAKK